MCEPQLGKYNLYPSIGGPKASKDLRTIVTYYHILMAHMI